MYLRKNSFFKIVMFSVVAFALVSFANIVLKPFDADGSVTFVIKNFGVNTSGSFKGLKGTINWDAANPASANFDVTVDAATVNTNNDMRDNHLRKEEYFDVAKYPIIHFVSTAVTATNVTGSLTVKGVTKTISFPYTVAAGASGGYVFSGSFTINRRDYNVGGGSMVLSDNVIINLKVAAK